MYYSDLTEWCAVKKGPKLDLIGEEAEAYQKVGIVFGASSHRTEHWWFFDQGMYFDSDVQNTNNAAFYGPAGNKRTAEAQAEPPDKPFLDDWLICQPVFQPYLKTFTVYYYNRGKEWGKQVTINFKE